MTRRTHIVLSQSNNTLLINHKRRTNQALIHPAVILLLTPRTIRLSHRMISIRQQRERQRLLLHKTRNSRWRIRRNTQHHITQRLQRRQIIAEIARLLSTTRSRRLRIKIQNHLTARIITQTMLHTRRISKGKSRRRNTRLKTNTHQKLLKTTKGRGGSRAPHSTHTSVPHTPPKQCVQVHSKSTCAHHKNSRIVFFCCKGNLEKQTSASSSIGRAIDS